MYYVINLIFKAQILHLKMGIGDWGLGIGDWGLGPIPNPQSPIPNPHILLLLELNSNNSKIIFKIYFLR
jgi:hypothetical protein